MLRYQAGLCSKTEMCKLVSKEASMDPINIPEGQSFFAKILFIKYLEYSTLKIWKNKHIGQVTFIVQTTKLGSDKPRLP